ncbi:MAG: phage protein Gp36 family protein [Candidatus Sumerlaeia bacterium]
MYATMQDIQQRLDPAHLIELADDNNDGTPDTDIIDAAIADADGLIDAWLGVRYGVPFDTVPALIRSISADLAVGSLFARRRESASPQHEARILAAKELLAALARGDIALAGDNIVRRAMSRSTTADQAKHFSRENLEMF